MASLKFRHYATESALKGTNNTVQDALNTFDVGTIVFIDDTQKQYIITSKSNNVVTYKIYYGKAAVVGVSRTDATLTLTFSDGSEIAVKINNVEHATSADTADTAKSVAWNNVTGKPTNFVTTDGTQTITGAKTFTNNVSLQGSTSADSITTEDLIVNGAARFVSGLTGDLKGDVIGNITGNVTGNVTGTLTGDATGNAGSATKLQTARNINGTSFNGTASITTAKWGTARTITIADNTNEHTQANNSIDGSANFTLKLPATIKADIIGNASTADSAKAVAWANVTNKPNLVTTDTEQTITGAKTFNNNTTFKNETDVESLTADSLLVTGSARFTNTINGNLKGNVEGNLTGNASTATTAATATEFSANKAVTLTGDVTGSASSKGGWSVATTIANGAVTNAKLANSKITIAGTAVSLGGSIAASTIGAALTTSAPAAYATNAGTATKAAEAEKAIKDSDGNVINTTYIKTVILASGTNNGTLKLTVGGTTTDNIAVKGLGSAAYTDSESYAAASHIHNYLPLSGGLMNSAAFIAWNSGSEGNDLEDWSITDNGLRIISSTSTTSKAPTQYATGLHVKGRYGFQIASQGGKTSNEFFIKNTHNTIWNTLLHSNNYTKYTVKKDGTGASGTWGINITGNASSATKATNDGSGNTITSTYATKTERANNDITAASLTTSKLTLTRTAGNIEVNIPTWNQDTTGTAAKATADANGNNIINTYATKAEVAALPKSMVIKGTLDATHALPTSGMTEGDTYIVGASGTYNKIACKVGDFFVRTSNNWLRIPAGDEWEYNENTIKGIKVNNAGHADTADTAVSAGSATSDSNGDNIANTYARINKVYDDSGDYRQFLGKNGDSSNWIRTTTTGIIPYTSGNSSNGHSSLGTPSWYFSKAYIQNIYGYLNGNISGSSTSCSGNSATATMATNVNGGYGNLTSLITNNIVMYPFGGYGSNTTSANQYFRIKFGTTFDNSSMIVFDVVFRHYEQIVKYSIESYLYGNTNKWYLPSVTALTNIPSILNEKVFFAYDSENHPIVYIKRTGGSYDQCWVENIHVGYSGTIANFNNVSISNVDGIIEGDTKQVEKTPIIWASNAISADIATSAISANTATTATKAGYLDTGTMTLYAHNSNEINFGGTSASSEIYVGYRATENRPIPTKFIFGGSAGTATLAAGGFKKKDSSSSYVLTGDGGHAAISGLSVNYATSSGSCSGNSATATKATQDSDGNIINTTYLKRSGGTVTGNITFNSSVTSDSLTTEDLIVNGSARFVSGLTGDLVGNVTGNLTGTASYATNAGSATSAGTATTSSACTGNAATATKLQTARTIWGRSFDGSGNVDGVPLFPSAIDINRNPSTGVIVDSSKLGLEIETYANSVQLKTYLASGVSNSANLVFTSSGNVGIGTDSPTSKLHVAGTGYFASDVSSAANIIAGGYIKGETVKISSGCTLEYSSTDKCIRFVFN